MLENVETWETACVVYDPFNFGQVLGEERKFIRLLAKDLGGGGLEYSVRQKLGEQDGPSLQPELYCELMGETGCNI